MNEKKRNLTEGDGKNMEMIESVRKKDRREIEGVKETVGMAEINKRASIITSAQDNQSGSRIKDEYSFYPPRMSSQLPGYSSDEIMRRKANEEAGQPPPSDKTDLPDVTQDNIDGSDFQSALI